MKIKKHKKLLIVVVILVFITAGLVWYFSPANEEYAGLGMSPHATVAQNAITGSNNRVFAEYIKQMGYDTFLSEPGPFTVFAPTDQAYNNLPPETASSLVNPADEGSLRAVLQYHVVEGRYLAEDLKDGMVLTTVQGENISIKRNGDEIILNGYSYIDTYDILSTNGVIHVTTNYLLPPSMVTEETN